MASTYTLYSDTYDGRYLELTCTQTKDIANNKSTISWTLSSKGGNSNYYSTGATKVTINGEQVYYKARVSHSAQEFPATKGSVSDTTTVNHNADGTKSIYVSFSTVIYDAESKAKTYSGSWTLDSIPRAATLSSATDFTDAQNPTITYSNPAGTGADALEAFIYTADDTTILVDAKALDKTKTSATLSMNSTNLTNLYNASKNSNSITVKFYVRTKIGSSYYWSNAIDKTFTVTNANPVASVTHYDSNSAMTALTGSNQKYVKYHSNMVYDITATPQKQATISSYQIALGSKTGNTKTGTLSGIDGGGYALVVTDSRGNTNTNRITNITCVPYINLTCSQAVDFRLVGETGLTATLTATGNYYSGSFGAVNNSLTIYYRYKVGSGSYGAWQHMSTTYTISNGSYSATVDITGLTYDKAYTFQCAAFDAVYTGGVNSGAYTASYTPVFDWSKTDFNFNVPVTIDSWLEVADGARISGNLEITGNTLADFVIETGTEAMGSNGTWYWRKWKSGRADCYGCRNYGNMAVNNQWGSLYESEPFQQDLPTGLFVKDPEYLDIEIVESGHAAFVMQGYAQGTLSPTQTSKFTIVRPISGNISQVWLGFNVIGRWKQ